MMLHGWAVAWGGELGIDARALDELAPHFRAMYPVDVPGMGASSRAAPPLRDVHAALQYFLTDYDAVHEHIATSDPVFRSSPWFLIAYSFGGYVAAEWMLRDPDRFSQLMLASPVGVPGRPPQCGCEVLRAVRSPAWSSGVVPQDALRIIPQSMATRYSNALVPTRFGDLLTRQEERVMSEYLCHMGVAPTSDERFVTALLAPGAWAIRPLHTGLPHLAVPCTFS